MYICIYKIVMGTCYRRHPNLETFGSEWEKQIFEIEHSKLSYSNFSKEKWQAKQALGDVRSIVIEKADKDLGP